MRFAFIHSHAQTWRITTMCRVLAVSKAGYYAWRARPQSARAHANGHLTATLTTLYHDLKRRYGSPRLWHELRARGIACGQHRVARLMAQAGLRAKSARRFRRTPASAPPHPVAPNRLQRQFAPAQHPVPDRTWAADMTYIPTGEGWLYLAVVLDLSMRGVVGWALRTRPDQELALSALQMALAQRDAHGGLHHSDRGSPYTSQAYQHQLRTAGLTPSLSRAGDCWDNAVVESFFATLTKELLVDTVFATRAEARRAVFEFIEVWYNRQRRHSALGYRSPAEYEAQLLKAS